MQNRIKMLLYNQAFLIGLAAKTKAAIKNNQGFIFCTSSIAAGHMVIINNIPAADASLIKLMSNKSIFLSIFSNIFKSPNCIWDLEYKKFLLEET